MNSMRLLKHLLLPLVAAGIFVFAAAPAFGDDAKAPGDVIATLQQAGKFGTFLKAVNAAGLTRALKKGTYTVFAPTDDAFAKLAPGTLDDLMKTENKAKLVRLVQYHIVPRELPSSTFAKTSSPTHTVETLAKMTITFSSDNSGAMVNGARIEETDLKASNGVIHTIDTVLTPPQQ